MAGIEPALRFNRLTDERLAFAKQVGAESVIVHPYDLEYLPEGHLPLSPDGAWSFEDLLHLRTCVEDAGLWLGAIENFPIDAYEDVMLGREGSEAILDRLAESVRNMGRADIPVLGYHWMPNGVWRTSLDRPGRGGAKALAFDAILSDRKSDTSSTSPGWLECINVSVRQYTDVQRRWASRTTSST